jgi:hypothetical protein
MGTHLLETPGGQRLARVAHWARVTAVIALTPLAIAVLALDMDVGIRDALVLVLGVGFFLIAAATIVQADRRSPRGQVRHDSGAHSRFERHAVRR